MMTPPICPQPPSKAKERYPEMLLRANAENNRHTGEDDHLACGHPLDFLLSEDTTLPWGH
jgi:hypothetical protein